MSTRTDAEIIRSACEVPTEFGEIVTRHYAVVHRYASRRLGVDTADDIASEAFTAAFAQRSRYDLSFNDARPWLLGIATNLIRHHTRTEARALKEYARTGVDAVAPGADEADRSIGAAVAGALAALRPKYRDVLFLHAVAELSHEEIARAMDVPVGTVKGWLHRARESAATELLARGVPEPPSRTSPTPKAAES